MLRSLQPQESAMPEDVTYRINVEINPFGQVHEVATIYFNLGPQEAEPRILPSGTAVREVVSADPPRILLP
jgi:hypothetical protein